MDLKSLKKINFGKLTSYFNFSSDSGREINMMRDWKILFCFFVVVFFISFIVNLFIFWQTKKEQPLSFPEKKIVIKEKALNSILEEIDKKQIFFNDNIIVPPSVKDPSI